MVGLAGDLACPPVTLGTPKLREVYGGCKGDSRAHTAHGSHRLEGVVVRRTLYAQARPIVSIKFNSMY